LESESQPCIGITCHFTGATITNVFVMISATCNEEKKEEQVVHDNAYVIDGIGK